MTGPDGNGSGVTRRFVGIIPLAVGQLVDDHRLTVHERHVLITLLLAADHSTGDLRCTMTELGELIGIDRRNLRTHLGRLTALRLIETYFPRGHEGAVRVLCYLDLVHLPPSQRTKHPMHTGRLLTLRQAVSRRSHGTKRPTTRDETSRANSGFAMSVSVEPRADAEVAQPASATTSAADPRGRGGGSDATPTPPVAQRRRRATRQPRPERATGDRDRRDREPVAAADDAPTPVGAQQPRAATSQPADGSPDTRGSAATNVTRARGPDDDENGDDWTRGLPNRVPRPLNYDEIYGGLDGRDSAAG